MRIRPCQLGKLASGATGWEGSLLPTEPCRRSQRAQQRLLLRKRRRASGSCSIGVGVQETLKPIVALHEVPLRVHVCAITPTSCHVPDLWQFMCSPDQNPGAGTGTEAEKPGSSGGSSVYVTGHCSAQSKRFHHLELAPSFVACSRPGAAVISIPHHRAPTSQARSQMRRSSRRRRTTRRCAMTRISSLS